MKILYSNTTHWHVLLCFLLILFIPFTRAQQGNSYNLDSHNGLPSNHVYMSAVDKWGYLWLATERGVVKYNGYSFKKFDYASGLVNEDIYGIQPDFTGRIWLYNFFGKLTCIEKDKLKYPVNAGNYFLDRIYHITPYKNTILFTSDSVYKIRNDSIISIAEKGTIFNNKAEVFEVGVSAVRQYRYDDSSLNLLKICVKHLHISSQIIALNNKIISFSRTENTLSAFDMSDCSEQHISFDNLGKNDPLRIITHPDDSSFFAITRKKIYKINDSLKIISTINIDSLSGQDIGSLALHLMRDSLWGTCISTKNNGLYISMPEIKGMKKAPFELTTFKSLGVIRDTYGYWWDNFQSKIVKITQGTISTTTYKNIIGAKHIHAFDDVSSTLMSGTGVFKIDNKTNKLKNSIQYYSVNGRKLRTNEMLPIPGMAIFIDTIHGYTNTFDALNKLILKEKNTVLEIQPIEKEVFNAIFYDSTLKLIYATGYHSILVYDTKTSKKVKLPQSIFERLGIHYIEKIYKDVKYNNIFLQDRNGIYIFNPLTLSIHRVFRQINTVNTHLIVNNGQVIAVGRFGIAISNIEGLGKISTAEIYPNVKDRYFSIVSACQLLGDDLILTTDNGTYEFDLNSTPLKLDYRLNIIANYADTSLKIKDWDTLILSQANEHIGFDVINPWGNGKLDFYYHFNMGDINWKELFAGELALSNLNPGKYYKLQLKAKDASWVVGPISIYLYIKPYWWQTTWGKNIIWILIVLFSLILLYLTYMLMKQFVNKRNEKRTRLLSLEINSLYAQINPHFIFNSMNSVLSLIELKKLNEAHTHILQFSGLLRGYLKSSRNRYIAINEEVQNLSNYIELQQSRFNSIFKYSIIINDDIDIHQTYIPSLLLQPLVENAINHGLLPKEKEGKLTIKFQPGEHANEIICTIEDNGIGREKTRLQHRGSAKNSYGNILISELVEIFNKYEDMKIRISYYDKQKPDTGLIVTIKMKKIS